MYMNVPSTSFLNPLHRTTTLINNKWEYFSIFTGFSPNSLCNTQPTSPSVLSWLSVVCRWNCGSRANRCAGGFTMQGSTPFPFLLVAMQPCDRVSWRPKVNQLSCVWNQMQSQNLQEDSKHWRVYVQRSTSYLYAPRLTDKEKRLLTLRSDVIHIKQSFTLL